MSPFILPLLLLLSGVTHADAKKRGGKAKGSTSLGSWTASDKPLHKTDCNGRPCRPGEGNIQGYAQWSQPYEPTSEEVIQSKSKRPVHQPTAELYGGLITVARRVAEGGMVMLAAADFDYREVAENWFRAARRVGMGNALVHCLDSEAYAHLMARGVTASDGSTAMAEWHKTKLLRHIQRALAERHMAAAALVNAGLDVLLTDVSAVPMRDPRPFFASQDGNIDMLVPRSGCGGKKRTGCTLAWNFLFLRGSAPEPRRARVVSYIQTALVRGLIDFYLRWWAGHHCEYMGYQKQWADSRPTLEGGLTPTMTVEQPNVTAVVSLKTKRWCVEQDCLRLGMLPLDRFPPPGAYPMNRDAAIFGRSVRPGGARHRLRLDRYDEMDFEGLKTAMTAEGLWL